MSSVENVDVNIYLDLMPSSLGGTRQTEYLVKGSQQNRSTEFAITKKHMQFILSYPHTKEELKTQQTDRTRTSETISYLKR